MGKYTFEPCGHQLDTRTCQACQEKQHRELRGQRDVLLKETQGLIVSTQALCAKIKRMMPGQGSLGCFGLSTPILQEQEATDEA